MKKVLMTLFLCAIFAFQSVAIETSAKSAILYDAENGMVLYEKDADTQRAIASTTKIMTALLTIENANLDDVVTVQPEQVGIEGTSLYLKDGEQITVKTLLYGLMLRSGNDAAETLARHVGGDVETFVSMMNVRASELGMENTHFKNPHGLPADGHVSTARDMAQLAAFAMKNDVFREVVSTKNYTAEGRSFVNHNKLLNMREEIDGVKTGFTKAAGRCLVSSALKNDMRLVVVTLSDPNDWDDHIYLYDFGFENFTKKSFCKKGEKIAELPIAGTGKSIAVKAEKDLSIVDKKSEISNIKLEIHLPRFCYAPIEKDEHLGELRIIKNGEIIECAQLYADESVEAPKEEGLIKRIFEKFKRS